MVATSSPPSPSLATHKLATWLTHLGVSRQAFDDTLSLINPLLTVHRLHARVVEKIAETASACTLVLQAGAALSDYKPGQFIMVAVVINGVRHRRAYSLRAVSEHPQRLAITVQRQPGGLVSNHLNEHTRIGQILEIEQASGDFTLPSPLPAELLLIAGGSGITPSMAMLEHLQTTQAMTRVTLIYFARSQQERIFANKLMRLAKTWPALHYIPIDSTAHVGAATAQRAASTAAPSVLSVDLLEAVLHNWSRVPTYCCGPAPLMDAARAIWQQAKATSRLHLEAFAPAKVNGDPLARHAISLTRAAHTAKFESPGDVNLLVAGERAGLHIKHGCRQGICHECTCRLRSGTIQDLSTGQRIEGEGQPVRLCVSAAMSDLDLESLN